MVLSVEIDQMKFSTPIPEGVFNMVPPKGFKTFLLRDEDSEQ